MMKLTQVSTKWHLNFYELLAMGCACTPGVYGDVGDNLGKS